MLGRVGVGIDLDPLAVLLSRAKTTVLDPRAFEKVASTVVQKASARMVKMSPLFGASGARLSAYGEETQSFFEYWFERRTSLELSCLRNEIAKVRDATTRNVLKVAFSSIIITKSGGVTLSRDLAHTRPHKDPDKEPGAVLPLFQKAVKKMIVALESLVQASRGLAWGEASVARGDSRLLPMRDGCVKLIVTSPPYAIALDYMRAHKFSLSWFGYDMSSLRRLRSKYIGAESGKCQKNPTLVPELASVLSEINKQDRHKARSIANYFSAMETSLGEMHRVLQPGGYAILVVGPSSARRIEIPTHRILGALGESKGFDLLTIRERMIDRNSRQLPVSNNSVKEGIERRIYREYIVPFFKN